MKKFARKSSTDGKGINQGYIFNDGDYYCHTTQEAKAYIENLGLNWQEEIKKFNTNYEWFYYGEWEEIDPEEFYDIEGNIYTTCQNCYQPLNIEVKFCANCRQT